LAYILLQDKFMHPLSPRGLLSSAWDGVSDRARRAGVATNDLNPAFKGDRLADYLAFREAYMAVLSRSGGKLEPQLLSLLAVDAMAEDLQEGHTTLIPPTPGGSRDDQARGGVRPAGIGVAVLPSANGLLVYDIFPGSPAEGAGVRLFDTIIGVDGRRFGADFHPRAAALVGPTGSKVRLTLQRVDGSTVEVSVIRAPLLASAVTTRVLPGGVGYIRIPLFASPDTRFPDGRTPPEALDAALESFEAGGVNRWVVDLRDNPGGAIDGLAALAGRFIADGLIVSTFDRASAWSETLVDGHAFRVHRPLVVLVNESSASSAELFAAAIQEYGRGRIVGVKTAGAVNGAEIWPLPSGAALEITVSIARTGKGGRTLEGIAVTPDLVARDTRSRAADFNSGRDPQLEAAVAELARQPERAAAPAAALRGDALDPSDLRALLGPMGARAEDFPAEFRLAGDTVLDTPNVPASGAPRAAALRDQIIGRHWQGSFRQTFAAPDLTGVRVTISLHGTEEGARQSLAGNDYPTQLRLVPPPSALGEEALAARGINASAGVTTLSWRRGRVIFTVHQVAVPGEESFDLLTALARKLDDRNRNTAPR
jgi:carboxyl-terminal processing protease